MKKKLIVLLMVISLLVSATPAFAADTSALAAKTPEVTIDVTAIEAAAPELAAKASSANQAKGLIDPIITPQAMQYIAWAETSLNHAGGGKADILGDMWTYGVCDVLGMDFSIQYWNGSSWVTIKEINAEGYNRSSYTVLISGTFTTGYWYRIMTDYYVHEGSATEFARTYTSPLYIQ